MTTEETQAIINKSRQLLEANTLSATKTAPTGQALIGITLGTAEVLESDAAFSLFLLTVPEEVLKQTIRQGLFMMLQHAMLKLQSEQNKATQTSLKEKVSS